jgi:phosphoribosylanthranilate isomerase
MDSPPVSCQIRAMMLSIKICGLSTEEGLDAALEAGTDMVGLNLFQKSPRFVAARQAAALAGRARDLAEVVALAVDMDDANLDEAVRTIAPDWLQLHGLESPERTAAIKARYGIRVMKAIRIGAAADLATVDAYAGIADLLLLDAAPPKNADRPGGHGVPFDWTLLNGFRPGIPWLLSGGLTPGNVGEAIRMTGAPGVDVSSGVETVPGAKDPDLIRAFIAAARRAAAAPAARERAAS